MRCIRIALYDIKSGSFDEVVRQAKAGMVPLFQKSNGFVSYGVAQIDKAAFVSLSTGETHEQANAATAKAADWVKANSRDGFSLRDNYVGDLAIDIDSAKLVELPLIHPLVSSPAATTAGFAAGRPSALTLAGW
jgi:hypothetical protein